MQNPLDPRRKRLIFRSKHRGTREIDMLLGQFAERHVPAFTDEQLSQFEQILDLQDPDLYDWMIGRHPVPPHVNTEVMQMLVAFQPEPVKL